MHKWHNRWPGIHQEVKPDLVAVFLLCLVTDRRGEAMLVGLRCAQRDLVLVHLHGYYYIGWQGFGKSGRGVWDQGLGSEVS